ncbi:hypothetical protein C1H46_009225 [Malus baccata]|uniref:Receptor ligand binding region domain-containing protein n=1 Tax=Malus baccata TaxID=106549 RepID=A0A540N2G3_MALBA|nr:hypothetical protein C1H46_009225 [Malus baccata]
MGPESSTQTNFVISLGDKAQVPIISYSATSPTLTSIRSEYFFRETLNDSSQVKAISAIIKAFGRREVVPIYVDNAFGEGVIPYLSDALQEVDARIPYRSVISPTATDDQIATKLYKLKGMQTQVFIVHMLPDLASRIFAKAKDIDMVDEGFQKKNSARNSSTTALEGFGISQNDPQLVQALLATSFKGLLGDFSLLNGELQSSTFQIVNVFGNGENLIGFWTPQNGLQRNFNSTKKSKYPTPNVVGLRSIIWPGDTTSSPEGWQIPTSEHKRLKIIVPVNTTFSEFLIVTHDPRTKKTTINGGYCIDVFEAVIKVLSYDVPYDLHPYATSNGEAAGSYDDLVDQVYLGVRHILSYFS